MPHVISPPAMFQKLITPKIHRQFSRNCSQSSPCLFPWLIKPHIQRKTATISVSTQLPADAPAPVRLGPSPHPHSQAGTQLEAGQAGGGGRGPGAGTCSAPATQQAPYTRATPCGCSLTADSSVGDTSGAPVGSLKQRRAGQPTPGTVYQDWRIWVGSNTLWIIFVHSFPLISQWIFHYHQMSNKSGTVGI